MTLVYWNMNRLCSSVPYALCIEKKIMIKKLEESHLPTLPFEDVTPNTYNNFFWPDKSDHKTDANVAEQKKTFRNIKGGEL